MMRFTVHCAAAAVFGLASTASAQNLIQNGGFETGDLSGFTPSGVVNVYQNNNGEYCCGLGGGVPEGTFAAAFGGGGGDVGSLGQTFTTSPGAEYDLDFLYARVGGAQDEGLRFSVIDAETNQLIIGLTFDDPTPGTFEGHSFQFVAPSASTRLEFASTPSGCCTDLLLDAVSVALVPEPAALGLLGVAGTGLLARRSRRRP